MPHKQRKLKNFLLDGRFQLKYTGMVLAVTVVVATILGCLAYRYSTGQTEALTVQLAVQPDIDPQTVQDLRAMAAEEDRKIALRIALGVAILALALGVTGIIVTHRVVGPVYRMRELFDEVGRGSLRVPRGIRKTDELQDLYQSFAEMVDALRDRRSAEIDKLEATLEQMEADGMDARHSTHLREAVNRLRPNA